MQREFSINIILLISINLLIKPFYIFGIDRTVQNVVGTENYGIYAALLSFTYIIQIINDFGLLNFNSREISQNRQLVYKYLPNILILKGILGFAFLAVLFLLAGVFGYQQYYHWLLFLGINQILIYLVFYLRSNLTSLGHFRIDSILSAMDKLLMIIICGYLLFFSPFRKMFTIEWFLYAQTASLLITSIVTFFLIGKYLPKRLNFKFNPLVARVLLKKSLPFALVIFLMTIYTRIDIIMLEKLLPKGKYHSGVYAGGYRILDALNMIGFLFATLLMPMFARMLKEKTPVNDLVRLSFKLIFAGSAGLSITIFFFRKEIMNLLYVEATPYWGETAGWLLFSFIAMTGTYIYGTLLTANGNLRKMNYIFTGSIVLNVLLNWWLIPQIQAVGASIATLITQGLVLIAQIILAIQLVDLKVKPKMIGQLLLYVTACFLIGYAFQSNLSYNWQIKFILTLICSGLAAFLLKLVNLKDALTFISSK